MAKFKFNLKKSWKNIVSITLAGVALLGAIVGISAIAKKAKEDTKEISLTFHVGAIDARGNYMESDTSIYTKDLFECRGLSIEPEFEATGTFSVYYYNEDKLFMGSSGNINAADGIYVNEDYYLAQYARIMITPAVPTDDEGNEEQDFKIRFYDVWGYADDYKITVNKDQRYKAEDRVLTFKVSDFIMANFTEEWSLETVTTTVPSRAVLNMYVPVKGTDAVIHCDDAKYTYKYAVYKDQPVEGLRLVGTGFVSGDSTVSQIDDEATYYICVGFEKTDKSDFTADDYNKLANVFSICYNG